MEDVYAIDCDRSTGRATVPPPASKRGKACYNFSGGVAQTCDENKIDAGPTDVSRSLREGIPEKEEEHDPEGNVQDSPISVSYPAASTYEEVKR